MANGLTRPLGLDTPLAEPARPSTNGLRVLRQLLAPRRLASRNRYRRLSPQGRTRLGGFLLLALAFGAAIFVFFYRALSYFLSVRSSAPC